MRFGLVGTGHWARIAHAPAVASTPGVSLAAVWGRNAEAARSLAAEHGAAAFSDVGAFLDAVDAVAFAVPPDVQAPLAIRAAEAGKHLLLEKPVALSVSDADKLVAAVAAAGVASVVFFTHQFDTEIRIAARPSQVVPAIQASPLSCTVRRISFVSGSEPKRNSTWLSSTSLRISIASSAPRTSAKRRAQAQQRSTISAIPSRPSERRAAQTSTPRARRESSGVKSLGLRNSLWVGRYSAEMAMEALRASGSLTNASPQS